MRNDKESLAKTERNPGRKTETNDVRVAQWEAGRTSFFDGTWSTARIGQLGKVLKRHKRREMAERESLLLRDLSEPADEEPKPTSTVCAWPCLEEARVRRTEDLGTSMQVLRR